MITLGGGVTFSKWGGKSFIFPKTSKEVALIYPKNRVFFQTNLEELSLNPLNGGSNDHPHVPLFLGR